MNGGSSFVSVAARLRPDPRDGAAARSSGGVRADIESAPRLAPGPAVVKEPGGMRRERDPAEVALTTPSYSVESGARNPFSGGRLTRVD